MPPPIASIARIDSPPPRDEGTRAPWRDLYPPQGLLPAHRARLDALVGTRREIERGEALFGIGAPLDWLYEVHSGVFKSTVSTADGRIQVTGFQMTGELLGLDGIGSGRHAFDAVALEYSQVCAIPYEGLAELLRDDAALQHQFHRILSREIVRDQNMMMMLGNMRAEERVATFLLDMMRRLHERGFSSSSLILRMSRDDIGSYLGLTLETVSRTFSKLACDGVLEVKNRQVGVLSLAALRQAAGCQA